MKEKLKKGFRYSFLYYSLFLSVLLALISGVSGFGMFIVFVFIFTMVLLITRYIYGWLEKLGVWAYENYIKDSIEKIKKVQEEE